MHANCMKLIHTVRSVDQFLLQGFRVVCDKFAKIIINCVAVLDFIVKC